MKFVIALCLFAVALAAPQARDGDIYAETLRSDFKHKPDTEAFRHPPELRNGVNEEIEWEPEPSEGAITRRGSFYLPADDGSLIRVDRVIDSEGFRFTSPLIPELPQFILDQIVFAAANPQPQG